MFSIFTHVMKPVRNTISEPGLPVAQTLKKCFVKWSVGACRIKIRTDTIITHTHKPVNLLLIPLLLALLFNPPPPLPLFIRPNKIYKIMIHSTDCS